MFEVSQNPIPLDPGLGNSVPPTNGENPSDLFSPENMRIDPSYLLQGAVKTHLLHVPVKRPSKQDFIRVHPSEDYRATAALIELDEEIVSYWVLPRLLAEIDPNSYKLYTLYLAVNRQKKPFLMKVRIPGADGRINSWHSTLRDAAELAMKFWVKVVPDTGNKCYQVEQPVAKISDPEWPNLSFVDLMRLAFKNLVIDNPDHEVLQRLRGEI
jgi:hypothetical protein